MAAELQSPEFQASELFDELVAMASELRRARLAADGALQDQVHLHAILGGKGLVWNTPEHASAKSVAWQSTQGVLAIMDIFLGYERIRELMNAKLEGGVGGADLPSWSPSKTVNLTSALSRQRHRETPK